ARRCPTARRDDRIPGTATDEAPPHSAIRTLWWSRRCREPARAWRQVSWSDSSTTRATHIEDHPACAAVEQGTCPRFQAGFRADGDEYVLTRDPIVRKRTADASVAPEPEGRR